MILVKAAPKFLPLVLCLLLLMAAGAFAEKATKLSASERTDLSVPMGRTLETDAHTYQGYLRIYIVELVSRYEDVNNDPYENGHLDFAVNEPITLTASDTISQTVIWNATYFAPVTLTNVAVIAVVFNGEGHDADSDPDTDSGYYVAHYVDAAASALPGETAVDTASEDYTHTVFLEEGTKHS